MSPKQTWTNAFGYVPHLPLLFLLQPFTWSLIFLQLESIFRQKLKDPQVFISPTRLCVHNLPGSIDDAKLKKLILEHLADPSVRINEVSHALPYACSFLGLQRFENVFWLQCRVMRDLERVNLQGRAKSRGYAFVNFDSHPNALKALRLLNNNPEVFTEAKVSSLTSPSPSSLPCFTSIFTFSGQLCRSRWKIDKSWPPDRSDWRGQR